jgi:hypothetical protein
MQPQPWASSLKQIGDYSEATIALIDSWLKHVYDHEGQIPKRFEFRLKTITPYLDEFFLSEWRSYNDMTILASGSKLVVALGVDLTGKNIFKYVPDENKKTQQDYYQKLQGQPCAGLLVRWGTNMKGRPFMYRTIQLPLKDRQGVVKYFIGTGFMKAIDGLNYDTKEEGEIVNIDRQENVFLDIGCGIPKE